MAAAYTGNFRLIPVGLVFRRLAIQIEVEEEWVEDGKPYSKAYYRDAKPEEMGYALSVIAGTGLDVRLPVAIGTLNQVFGFMVDLSAQFPDRAVPAPIIKAMSAIEAAVRVCGGKK